MSEALTRLRMKMGCGMGGGDVEAGVGGVGVGMDGVEDERLVGEAGDWDGEEGVLSGLDWSMVLLLLVVGADFDEVSGLGKLSVLLLVSVWCCDEGGVVLLLMVWWWLRVLSREGLMLLGSSGPLEPLLTGDGSGLQLLGWLLMLPLSSAELLCVILLLLLLAVLWWAPLLL